MDERIKMVKAMEFICRQINDESVFYDVWAMEGVADGDIEYGNLTVESDDIDKLDWYLEEENFRNLMDTFLYAMKYAMKSGGLYCDGVCTR